MMYVDIICYLYIHFYCRDLGVVLMTEDAIVSHLTSLNYLVATQFNGSGGSKKDKDLKERVLLCEKVVVIA
jgi:hypothetical protein